MPKDFQLVIRILGYLTKPDPTNLPLNQMKGISVLVSGSQNMLINDEEMVETRGGYTLYGAAGSESDAIESAYDWKTSSNSVINFRSYSDELEFYAGTVGGVEFNAWTRLEDGWAAVDFSFTTWWDTSEAIDILLFVVGDDKIYDWSGGVASLASATANTITKNGATTWGQERFLTSGTRKVIINGTTYTYTGGEDTTILTGVTPNPSTEAADSLVFQEVRTNDNQPADGTVNDWIKVLNNQVWIGSLASREIYVSANDDFTDYTFSSPRIPGEGALLTLDGITRGFARLGKYMLIASGRDDWYRSSFEQLEISTTLVETLNIKKLKTGSEWAAQSQDLIAEVGDTIAFVSFEPALRIIESVEELDNPQMPNASDPIKPDFDDEDFTNGQVFFHKNRIYISCPNSDKVYITETRQDTDRQGKEYLRRFWQPPQILPMRRFSIVSGDLHGHSNGTEETYKLFDGTNDNGNSFTARAKFAYRSYGKRENYKLLDEWLTEGFISSNTKLTLKLNYDFGGATQLLEEEIDGGDNDILFELVAGGSLGDEGLGGAPLGDQEEEGIELPKFRSIKPFPPEDFFEIQAIYETSSDDAQWKILAHGGNARLSPSQPTSIKK